MKIQLNELKNAYDNAKKKKLKKFMLYDFELMTDYAKYLIQYLEGEGIKDEQLFVLEDEEEKLSGV